MQATASPPPKPWQRGAGSGGVPPAAGVAGVNAGGVASLGGAAAAAAAPAGAAAPAASAAAAQANSSGALAPAATSSYASSSYGNSMYGRSSMYGGGSSMYGGGYGSSMYGGGYGGGYGGSMYGRGMGGGMYGNRQQESEFFAPKRPEAEGEGRQQHPVRLADLREMNASFLDALHAHGVRLASAAARLLESVVGPRLWARDWRAAAVAIGAAALAAAARAWLRRRRRLAWRALSAGSYLAAGPLLTGPQPLAFAGALAPRAAL